MIGLRTRLAKPTLPETEMNGTDVGTVAQNFITYFGGAAGGYILAAALVVVGLLAAAHVVPSRLFWISMALGIAAWTASYAVRTTIGWA
jgi:hypothetical protein